MILDTTLDRDGIIAKMKAYGFNYTADSGDQNKVFFLKRYDNKIFLHALVNIKTQAIILDSTSILPLGMTITSMPIPLENKHFVDFENKLYLYVERCLAASDDDDSSDGGWKPVQGPDEIEPTLSAIQKKPAATIKERKTEFWERIRQAGKEKGYEKEMCQEFFSYWIEMNDGGKKMRFEMQKVFDTSRRLSTWLQNDKKWATRYKGMAEIRKEQQEKQLTQPTKVVDKTKYF